MLNQTLVAHGMFSSSVANKNTPVISAYTFAGSEGIVTNTSAASFTVKLPDSPSVGTAIFIYDGADWSVNNLIVDPQSKTIENFAVSETLALDMAGGGVQFVYDGSKWKFFILGITNTGYASAYPKTGGDLDGSINITGNTRRIMGIFSGAVHATRTLFQNSIIDAATTLGIIPNGTSKAGQLNIYNSSDPDNSTVGMLHVSDAEVSFRITKTGTANYLPMTWWNNGVEFMRLSTNGNLSLGRNLTGPYDVALRIEETTFATSKRAGMTFGSAWALGQDSNGNGTKDFFLYSVVLSSAPLLVTPAGHTCPGVTNTFDLGSTTLRWRNIYTQDLHLSNGIGDYTMIEGEEHLYLVNNKNGKHYRFALIAVDPSEVPPKSEAAHGS